MHARTTVDCDILPSFTAAYLRTAGDECAFIETHTAHAVPKLMAELERQGKRPEHVRWVVVTHAHLDHAAGASALLARCPNATLLAHPRAARHLIDPSKLVASATAVYGEERFAKLYGRIDPIAAERVRALEDGETFDLGDAKLRVHHTAGHAKHHVIVEDPALATVYTGDTFGLVYPALQGKGRFAIASTSPTDFDAAEARRSIAKVMGLGMKAACLTHFDEVKDLSEVAAQVGAWVDRSERWVAEAAASGGSPAEMEAGIVGKIRAAIAEESAKRGLGFGAAEEKLLELDVMLNAQGLAFVAAKTKKG